MRRVTIAAHPDHAAQSGLDQLPPIHRVTLDRSATWLERGARDFGAHPEIGLSYGAFFALGGWLLSLGLSEGGMGSLVLPFAAGFMLLAPVLAVGLYDVSRRLEQGERPSLAKALAAFRSHKQIADMGFVLLLVFFAWFQIAMVIFALFFGGRPPALDEFVGQILLSPVGLPFLLAGTIAGGILAAGAFAISVVSIPMLLDRDVTVLTAIRTSLAVCRVNRMHMIGWAATLATLGFVGLAFFFVGLAVTLPIAAHASWHAYRDMVGD